MNARFLIVPALVAGLQAASAGDITGTITLDGKAPEPQIIDMSSVPDCAKQHTDAPKLVFYRVGPKNELGDVVIIVKNMSGKSTGESAAPVVLDQKGCEYNPYVTAVQTGQKILVRNSDPTVPLHNVDVVPMAAGNTSKMKNTAQAPGAPDVSVSFPAEENFVHFKCDVHPWMHSYVTVVDSPYFSVSAANGTYKISNLPPGKYTVEATHRKAHKVSKEIEVKDGNNVLDFTMEVPK